MCIRDRRNSSRKPAARSYDAVSYTHLDVYKRQEVGDVGVPRTVSGTNQALWGWITGRTDGADLEGAEGMTWRLLG